MIESDVSELGMLSRALYFFKKKHMNTAFCTHIDNMLTEHFVASIHTPLKTSAPGFKDVGIFINELQPLAGQRQAFKRSATVQNCLAVSDGHIFAAQAEKAAVHVYNRERGNHEATIPFNEKITSLVLAASGFVLLLGTKGGRVIAWEVSFCAKIAQDFGMDMLMICVASYWTLDKYLAISSPSCDMSRHRSHLQLSALWLTRL
jgi:hypothetical protein